VAFIINLVSFASLARSNYLNLQTKSRLEGMSRRHGVQLYFSCAASTEYGSIQRSRQASRGYRSRALTRIIANFPTIITDKHFKIIKNCCFFSENSLLFMLSTTNIADIFLISHHKSTARAA
jgi:hypothetical protein